jgi:citrate synthase
VENATFGEVAYLLWEGKLPNKQQFDQLKGDVAALMTLPEHVSKLLPICPRRCSRWTRSARRSARWRA